MSIISTDHVVVPENADIPEAVENAGTEAVEAAPETTFADLGLPEGIVRKLAQNGVTTPFPIQAATIPDALAGKDILGRVAPAPARPSPSVCRPWRSWPAAAPRSTSPAPSSSPRPASWPCRWPTRSSRTATSSACG